MWINEVQLENRPRATTHESEAAFSQWLSGLSDRRSNHPQGLESEPEVSHGGNGRPQDGQGGVGECLAYPRGACESCLFDPDKSVLFWMVWRGWRAAKVREDKVEQVDVEQDPVRDWHRSAGIVSCIHCRLSFRMPMVDGKKVASGQTVHWSPSATILSISS